MRLANYDGIDMAISSSICWKMDLYDMKAHSLIPHLLRSFDESHLFRAEMFRFFCYDLIAFKQGVSFASGQTLFWLWVIGLGFKFLCFSVLRRVTPAPYPILYPRLG